MSAKTYIIDFDSTLVTVESLDELANIALEGRPDRGRVMAKLQALTAFGMSGKISFDESLNRRLKLFRANRKHVDEVVVLLQSHISPSALAHRAWFQEHSRHIYIISGGFEDYVMPVAKQLGVAADHIFANRFIYDENGNIVDYDRSRLTGQTLGKVKQLKALSLPKPIVVIGDGFTDYEIKAYGAAQEFWAFTETTCRDKVAAKADKVLSNFDGLMGQSPRIFHSAEQE